MRHVSDFYTKKNDIFLALVSSSLLIAAPALAAEEAAGEIASVQGIAFVRPDGRQASGALKPAKPGDPVHAGDVINTSSTGKIKLILKDKSIVDVGPSALFKIDGFKKNGGEDRQVDTTMMYGTVRAAVTQKIKGAGRFNIRTSTATMGVRGTDFAVNAGSAENVGPKTMEFLSTAPVGKSVPASVAAADDKIAEKEGKPKPSAQAKASITVFDGKVAVMQKEEGGRKPGSAAAAAKGDGVMLTAGTRLSLDAPKGDAKAAKVENVPKAELASMRSSTIVKDNTFSNAVTIDMKSATGGGESGMGAATMKEVATAMAAVEPPKVSVSDMGVPGTFTVNQVFTTITNTPQAQGNKSLRVVIRRAR